MSAQLPAGAAPRVAPLSAPLGVKALFGILFVVGAIAFFSELRFDATRANAAYLLGFYYFTGLGLAGTFFTALHHLVGATWSVVMRRVAESFTSMLPVAILLALVLIPGVPHLYVWASAGMPHGAEAEYLTKEGWLTGPMFTLRVLGILTLWAIFAWYLVRNSTRQDETRALSHSRANVKASAVFILLFAVTLTLISFDLLMSLEPTWFSTIFGVYCFAGIWQSGLAAIAITTIILRRQGALQGIVSRFHYHDIGKLMFAFSVFWMYIAFSQLLIIWYANLPEETEWMIHRIFTDWGGVGIALMALKFGVPFFVLLHQKCKESEGVLLIVGTGILIGQWIDLYWIILPAFSPEAVVFGWPEIAITLGFLGLFGWQVLHFFSRHAVAPHGDPAYDASVRFHG